MKKWLQARWKIFLLLFFLGVFAEHYFTLETLRLRFFGISRQPRTSRSHVTRALPSGSRLYGWTTLQRHVINRKVFCSLKHHNLTFENKYDFLELFCLLIIEFYFKRRNFEDNVSPKIEVSGWMKTNMAAASYHPRILSPGPNMGRQVTWNREPQTSVCRLQ